MNSCVIPAAIKNFLQDPILSMTPLTGGSVCQTYKITTHSQAFVYKHLHDAPEDFFRQEKAGLQYLAQSNSFKTPHVVLCDKDFMLMEYITHANHPRWEQFGERLANLHRHTAADYGLESNNFFAALPQNNQWQTHWLDFYRDQRLAPLIQHPLFNQHDRQQWDTLLGKLEQYIDNSEPASLIHGDLWNTNILFAEQDIYVIDPAVYYASREIEIAYLEFVGDAHPQLLRAYQEYYPLSKDYAERKNLYLLYPYLIHLHLFGEAYLAGLRNILNYYC